MIPQAQWPTVRLGEVLTPVSREESVDATRAYPLLGVRLDGRGPFLRETVRGAETAANHFSRVAKGDFIYSRLFAWRGAFGVISEVLDGAYVSDEFPTFTATPDCLDSEFLRYWFRLPSTLERVTADCTGSTPLTRNRFKEHFFLALEIPLPPLAEQQRIVARIEELGALIDEARALRQQAAEEAGTLCISLHCALAGARKKLLWELFTLDESSIPVVPSGSYPQVGLKSFGGGLFAKPAVLGSETAYKAFNRLYAGALVLSQVKGWEGAVAICPAGLDGWFVSPEYRTFRCISAEARPTYLAPLVRTRWFWERLGLATRGVGARRERTRPDQFLRIEMPMPDTEAQQRSEAVLANVAQLECFQAETAAELDALLPSILDRAFDGEL